MKRTTASQVSHFDIGWLAGIIDGEGSLAHYYCKRGPGQENRKRSPIYGVYIVNSDEDILDKVKYIYKCLGIYGNISVKPGNALSKNKPCYQIVVRRRLDVEKLLKIITPHLHGKKQEKSNKMLHFFSLNPFNTKKQIRV